MEFVYVVVENGESYPAVYVTYAAAVSAVKRKHREIIEQQIKEVQFLDLIEKIILDINVPENVSSNNTNLYIEKGINIIIHKLYVCQVA